MIKKMGAFFKDISDKFRLFIIRLAVVFVAVGSMSLALSDNARIYDLVAGAYSVTLVAAFIPLAFGLYSKKVNSFGAMVSIVSGIGVWQYLSATNPDAIIPATFYGFLASLIGIIIGSLIGNLIKKEEELL